MWFAFEGNIYFMYKTFVVTTLHNIFLWIAISSSDVSEGILYNGKIGENMIYDLTYTCMTYVLWKCRNSLPDTESFTIAFISDLVCCMYNGKLF